MKILTKAVLAGALVAAAAVGYQQYARRDAGGSQPAAGKAPSARPAPVVLAPVETASVPIRLGAIGRAEAVSTVTLRARTDGQVIAVDFVPGAAVRKGQLLVRLDARAIDAQLQQAEANLARDMAQLGKARADLRRYEDLVAKGFVSAAQLDGYRATVDSLDATVTADQAAVELLRVQKGYTRIEAPMDGVAGAIQVHPGGSVKANDTPLVVVNQVRPIHVAFAVPETRLGELGRQRLSERLRVEASIAGAKDSPLVGELVFVDNAVDAATGTIQMKARFENADARLTPGQFVEVALTLRTLDQALLMPSEALQSGPDGNFVFVAKPDQTVEVRKVRTEQVDARRQLVLDGLKAGENVVVDGQVRLTPGGRYEAREPSRPAAAPSKPQDKPSGDAAGKR